MNPVAILAHGEQRLIARNQAVEQDGVMRVVEDEVALICRDGENGVKKVAPAVA